MSVIPALLSIQASTATMLTNSRRASGLYHGTSTPKEMYTGCNLLDLSMRHSGWRGHIVTLLTLMYCIAFVAILVVSVGAMIVTISICAVALPFWATIPIALSLMAAVVAEVILGMKLLYG